MFTLLEYIECEKEDLKEIINTLIPIHKTMPYFTDYYISGKDRYTKLTVANCKQRQIIYVDSIIARFESMSYHP